MNALIDGTIAAIATVPGRSAVALVRLSGPDAGEILLRVATSLQGTLPHPRQQMLLPLYDPTSGDLLDRALVTWFAAPASYTGEDTVEFATHGGALVPQLLLDALVVAGARLAARGEFTQRALENGKLDLLQAEAVLDLIDGRTRESHRAAINQLDRGLSRRIEELGEGLLRTEALAVYGIDFPDEDEPPVPLEQILAAAREVVERVSMLLATARQGELLREGALVVLAGEPNSGKSSLFNALLGVQRAIVTEVPGTTRDAIEGFADLGGFPFRLVDTAGLRETVDPIEGMGIEVAHRYLAAADLILFCVPANRQLNAAEEIFIEAHDPSRILLVRTMADLVGPGEGSGDTIEISSASGEGLDRLSAHLVELGFGEAARRDAHHPLVTRERHTRALRAAQDEILSFIEAAEGDVPIELATTHLRAAAGHLEEIVGVLTPDDVLGAVFASFCVGK